MSAVVRTSNFPPGSETGTKVLHACCGVEFSCLTSVMGDVAVSCDFSLPGPNEKYHLLHGNLLPLSAQSIPG